MNQRDRYRSTPPARTADDMPLAAYGGTGMEEDDVAEPAEPAEAAPVTQPAALPAPLMARAEDAPPPAEGEPAPPASLPARVIRLFRTSRLAAGAGFAVVILIGLVLLSSGGASPAATAATPTKGPTPAPTITPPSGEVSMTVTGAAAGTFTLAGLAGGQHVDAATVNLGWGDAQQTMVSITGPIDRGTRSTDERLVLTIAMLVNGQPVTFTSMAGECTIGMAQVGAKVQGSFTCHKLKAPDGKLTIEASGNYRT